MTADHKEAVNSQAVKSQQSVDATDLKNKGNDLFKNKEYKAALEAYDQALNATSKTNTDLRCALLSNKAATELQLLNYPNALASASAALRLDSKHTKSLFRKAVALNALGNPVEALTIAQQAAALDPKNSQITDLVTRLSKNNNSPLSNSNGNARKPPITAAVFPPLLRSSHFEYEGSADGVDENLLILLHGLGDKPHRYMQLAKTLALPQTALLALGGPEEVPFSDGGRSWYTVFDEEFNLIKGTAGETRITSLNTTVDLLYRFLQALEARCRWPTNKIHLLGFSQGGTVALELTRKALAAKDPIRSCVAVSASLLEEQLSPEWLRQAQKQAPPSPSMAAKVPVLITHGENDTKLTKTLVNASSNVVALWGAKCEVFSVREKGAEMMIRGSHEARRLMEFWAQHLSDRPSEFGGSDLLEVTPGKVERLTTMMEQLNHNEM